jgi:hypothetical protein
MIAEPTSWRRSRRGIATALAIVGAGALLAAVFARALPAAAADKGNARERAGTYFIQEASGAQAIWTLERDGAFLATSSTQPLFRFSDQQGVWENDAGRGVRGVILDFSFDANGNAINVARADVSLRPVDGRYDSVEGEFTLRFFEPGEDPLDPSSDTGQPINDTFVGRRLEVPR